MAFIQLSASQNHMATTFEFVVSTDERHLTSARTVLHEAHALVSRLENELTEFKEVSPIFRLNQSLPGTEVCLTSDGIALLEQSHYFETVTGNSFSCKAKSPDRSKAKVAWDAEKKSARRLTSDTQVGFGAIGKGYALDKVREHLVQNGFNDFLLQAGGSSIILSGFASPNVPWGWGWSWTKDENGEPLGKRFVHHSGRPIAIGVSGLQEKGSHIHSSEKFSHQSTLIACESATQADALSTAFFCSEWAKATSDFQELLDKPAMASIEQDSTPRWNGLFQELWGAVTVFLLWIPVAIADDGAIDLESLGLDDFMPYEVVRQPLWALAPLLMLLFITLHLKDSRPKAKLKPPSPEDPL